MGRNYKRIAEEERDRIDLPNSSQLLIEISLVIPGLIDLLFLSRMGFKIKICWE